VNDESSLAEWTAAAATLKQAANNLLWDEIIGLYKDNETTTLHPQDGNGILPRNLIIDSTQRFSDLL